MPFQPFNYADIAPRSNPAVANFIENLTSGYQASQLPKNIALEQQKQQLANQMSQMLNQEQPQKFQSDMATALSSQNSNNAYANNLNLKTPSEVALNQANISKIKQEVTQQQFLFNRMKAFTDMLNNIQNNNQTPGQSAVSKVTQNLSQSSNPITSGQQVADIFNNALSGQQQNYNPVQSSQDQSQQQRLNYTPVNISGSPEQQTQQLPSQVSFPQMNAQSNQQVQSIPNNMKPYNQQPNTVVLNPGNPSMQRIDQLYTQHPEFRPNFESMGYKGQTEAKFNANTGEASTYTTYPSGRVEVTTQQVGLSPTQLSTQKSIGGAEGKVYDSALQGVQNSQNLISNLDYLKGLVTNNPTSFKNIVGPMSSSIAKYAGSDQDKQLLGKLSTGVGNIVLDSAKSIKGAFTSRDQNLIYTLKPNVSDMPEVFQGKLEAMSILANLTSQRNTLIANYMRKGMSSTEAIEKARQQTDFSKVEDQVNALGKGTHNPKYANVSTEDLYKMYKGG